MKKILLHICCGPCATASIKKIQEDGYSIIGYYYNPNIHPNFEYSKRLKEARKLSEQLSFKLIEEEYNPKEYFEAIKGNEEAQNRRCQKCWELRIKRTAEKARTLGIGSIATTLRISPYQNQDELLEIGKNMAEDNGLNFYEGELSSCFRESVNLSKDHGMYRQKYCGCIFSKSRR